ncbi:putative ubiquitin carboxyl-terminal hydrolase [Rhizodiscina lignyota]|uniref:Ubiquitin carboxyl-terminal hydrolase n=1 Tax=Rhizodiscina lignyota TaxID=1504668 RepID=A0A9P4IRF7_9PEZI|nr:putative ubiquitin carboxyl-terminal hydrolase [Rhizodiscina lignyota]
MATEQEIIDSHDNPDVPAGRKRFVPLENNPEVMTSLVRNLGLSPTLSFHDVYSIDDPTLLSFVPRPAHALLLIFPVTPTYESHRRDEDASKAEYTGSGDKEPVVWFKQTIANACGLIGLLHGVSNGEAKSNILPGSDLADLVKSAIPLDPVKRAELLYESRSLEKAHASAAATGDTSAPSATDQVDLHFVCFVRGDDGHLWEMDGRRKGPLDRGVLKEGDDVLSEDALERSVRKFMERETDPRFSLVALAPSFD